MSMNPNSSIQSPKHDVDGTSEGICSYQEYSGHCRYPPTMSRPEIRRTIFKLDKYSVNINSAYEKTLKSLKGYFQITIARQLVLYDSDKYEFKKQG